MVGYLIVPTKHLKNQLKIKDLIQTLKEILDRRDINDRQWNYSIQ